MVEQIIVLTEIVALFIVLLTVLIILVINEERTHSKKMLGWFLLSLAVSVLISITFHFDLYTLVPWAFKVLLPVSLLIYPLSYLYIRSVLNNEMRFKKSDWLIFIPAILYAISLLPFYFMPIAEKRELLIAYARNPALRARFDEGVLPPYFFPVFRVAWSLLFVIINSKRIKITSQNLSESVLKNNVGLLNWLRKLNFFLWALLILAICTVFANLFYHTNLNFIEIFLSVSVLLICLQLFFTPKVLYGFSYASIPPIHLDSKASSGQDVSSLPQSEVKLATFPIANQESDSSLPTGSNVLSPSDRQRYKQRIEKLFLDERPFLRADYSLIQMVEDTGLPRYLLSAIINQEFGLGFREFLNRYRVEYFIANINSPEWQSITLEAIANQCGFVSRSTFITNFRQITGQTPSEYVKSLHG